MLHQFVYMQVLSMVKWSDNSDSDRLSEWLIRQLLGVQIKSLASKNLVVSFHSWWHCARFIKSTTYICIYTKIVYNMRYDLLNEVWSLMWCGVWWTVLNSLKMDLVLPCLPIVNTKTNNVIFQTFFKLTPLVIHRKTSRQSSV